MVAVVTGLSLAVKCRKGRKSLAAKTRECAELDEPLTLHG